MSCINFGGGIACFDPGARFKVDRHYVWMTFHTHCGPLFYRDAAMNKFYEPSEDDPLWLKFGKWLDKYNAAKAKRDAKKLPPNV